MFPILSPYSHTHTHTLITFKLLSKAEATSSERRFQGKVDLDPCFDVSIVFLPMNAARASPLLPGRNPTGFGPVQVCIEEKVINYLRYCRQAKYVQSFRISRQNFSTLPPKCSRSTSGLPLPARGSGNRALKGRPQTVSPSPQVTCFLSEFWADKKCRVRAVVLGKLLCCES